MNEKQLPLISGAIALVRLCAITLMLYGLLTLTASWVINNIQSKEGMDSNLFAEIIQFQEWDSSYWEAFVSISICQGKISCVDDNGSTINSKIVENDVKIFQKLNHDLELRYVKRLKKERGNILFTQLKSSNLSRAEIVDTEIYKNSVLSFKQGLRLLWASGLVMIFVLASMSVLRNIEEKYQIGFYLKYVGLLFLMGFTLFSFLPMVYFSTFFRPGQELLDSGFLMNEGIGPILMFVFDILFVISFAGIISQFGVEQLFKKTPEENMIHLRDGFPWAKIFILGLARSAQRLTVMIPFLLTATLFANARMNRGEGIYKLVQEVFRISESPGQGLQALILTTMIVVSLNTLGKQFMIAVQDMFYTIPLNKDIR